MKQYERLAVFIVRVLSLVALIYFLSAAIILTVVTRAGINFGVITLFPALIALIVFLCAPVLARLVAKDLD